MQQRFGIDGLLGVVEFTTPQESCYTHIHAAVVNLITVDAGLQPTAATRYNPRSPFDQLDGDEVVPVSAVEDDKSVGRRGFELEEEVHRRVGLKSGQAQVAALGLEGHGIGDDEAHAEAGVELAEVDVPVLAHVDVLHAVEFKALGGDGGHRVQGFKESYPIKGNNQHKQGGTNVYCSYDLKKIRHLWQHTPS